MNNGRLMLAYKKLQLVILGKNIKISINQLEKLLEIFFVLTKNCKPDIRKQNQAL